MISAISTVRSVGAICVLWSYSAYAGAPLRSGVNNGKRSVRYYRRKRYSVLTQVYRATECKILRVAISLGVVAASVLVTAALGFSFSQRHCPANRTAPSWEAKYYGWAPSPVSSEDFDMRLWPP